MRSVMTALLLAASLAVAGCGDTDPDARGTETSPTSASPTTASPSEELPVQPAPSRPPSAPTDVATQVTLSGTISLSGGQPGCVDLLDEATGLTWALVGPVVTGDVGAGPLGEGDRVRVTGRGPSGAENGAESYPCGIPLTVERITRL
jgi:hypothetical protein